MLVTSRDILKAVLCGAICLAAAPLLAQQSNITVQLPTFGVSVDAEGVLRMKAVEDPHGVLHAQRLAAARQVLPADLAAKAPLRKISLVRLEAEIVRVQAQGRQLDDTLLHLAGLQEVRLVLFYPDRHDIVLAGPAEGWLDDGTGRAVGLTSGAPVLLLEDLLAALRAYAPSGKKRPFVGCTINPTPAGLARFTAFQRTIPRVVTREEQAQVAEQVAAGVSEALGMAEIRIFGLPRRTHFAQVLVEADYRMKLIGIGLEPPPTPMATYLDLLKSAHGQALQRWWFTPDYDCVRLSADRLAMQLEGQGVQLQNENKVIGPGGAIAAGGKPSEASEKFTAAFTRKYPEIAARSPVYAQLRSFIGLLMAAAFIRQEDWYNRADWQAATLMDEQTLPIETYQTPTEAPCAVNPVWKGDRLLMPAGGGVSIMADEALAPARIKSDKDGKLAERRKQVDAARKNDRWWWD